MTAAGAALALGLLGGTSACTNAPALAGPIAPARIQLEAPSGAHGPRVLGVVAHPDDEAAFAATLYATAHLLDGHVELVVITNGEGGFKYATLAEPIYGLELTREEVGRAHLPAIRRQEMLASARLIGARSVRFLNERDHRYTQDVAEVLAAGGGAWNAEQVRAALVETLRSGRFEHVFLLYPHATTHGHHQSAAILTLAAVSELAPKERPAVYGVLVEREGRDLPARLASGLPDWPITRLRAGVEPFVFDRARPFGHRERLDWSILVNWVIAAHKSQGTMQLGVGRGGRELFHLFEVSAPGAPEQAAQLFAQLAEVTFEAPQYGPSAGTKAQAAPRR